MDARVERDPMDTLVFTLEEVEREPREPDTIIPSALAPGRQVYVGRPGPTVDAENAGYLTTGISCSCPTDGSRLPKIRRKAPNTHPSRPPGAETLYQ